MPLFFRLCIQRVSFLHGFTILFLCSSVFAVHSNTFADVQTPFIASAQAQLDFDLETSPQDGHMQCQESPDAASKHICCLTCSNGAWQENVELLQAEVADLDSKLGALNLTLAESTAAREAER